MFKIPQTSQKLSICKYSTNFREAVSVVKQTTPLPKADEICVKNKYVGVNVDDSHVIIGRKYFTDGSLPIDVGFEAIGIVVAIGEKVTNVKVGDPVAYISGEHRAYAQYACIPALHSFPVPEVKPEYLVLLTSGLTASIGFDKAGLNVKEGETILIAAAAGGLGHLTVQWAKLAGCHVIALCSTKEKEKFLKGLGCDRVINYKEEDLEEVLSKEYPDGVNVVWETVGGQNLELCLRHTSIKGRILVLGGTSNYGKENPEAFPRANLSTMPETIFYKSISIIGFYFERYAENFGPYYAKLVQMCDSGTLKASYNMTDGNEEFIGLEGIIRAYEFLTSRRNMGKVLAKIE